MRGDLRGFRTDQVAANQKEALPFLIRCFGFLVTAPSFEKRRLPTSGSLFFIGSCDAKDCSSRHGVGRRDRRASKVAAGAVD